MHGSLLYELILTVKIPVFDIYIGISNLAYGARNRNSIFHSHECDGNRVVTQRIVNAGEMIAIFSVTKPCTQVQLIHIMHISVNLGCLWLCQWYQYFTAWLITYSTKQRPMYSPSQKCFVNNFDALDHCFVSYSSEDLRDVIPNLAIDDSIFFK